MYERYREALSHVKVISLQFRSVSSKMISYTPPISYTFKIYVAYVQQQVQTVEQLVQALCYKTQGHDFDSWGSHWNFSLTLILSTALYPWGRLNLYQKWVLGIHLGEGGKVGHCVRLTTLPSSCADCLVIWEPQLPGTLRACTGISLPV